MRDYIKRFFLFCFELLIIMLGVLLVGCQNDEVPAISFDVPLFLEITTADDTQFDEDNRFEIAGFFTISQRSGSVRSGGQYRVENVEIGETEFGLPVRPTYVTAGEVVVFQIYQITAEMIAKDDTNRFQDQEWVSDQGWLMDETIFGLTVEFVVENETGRLEITKTRYENGNHIQVDEIRFMNHYLGN